MSNDEKIIRKFADLDSISKHLFCTICQEIFKIPNRLFCGHTYCQDCITEWRKKNNTCPVCRIKLESQSISKDLIAFNIINDLEVLCNNYRCPWKGTLAGLEQHLKVCLMDENKMPEFLKTQNEKNNLVKSEGVLDNVPLNQDLMVLRSSLKYKNQNLEKIISNKIEKNNKLKVKENISGEINKLFSKKPEMALNNFISNSKPGIVEANQKYLNNVKEFRPKSTSYKDKILQFDSNKNINSTKWTEKIRIKSFNEKQSDNISSDYEDNDLIRSNPNDFNKDRILNLKKRIQAINPPDNCNNININKSVIRPIVNLSSNLQIKSSEINQEKLEFSDLNTEEKLLKLEEENFKKAIIQSQQSYKEEKNKVL